VCSSDLQHRFEIRAIYFGLLGKSLLFASFYVGYIHIQFSNDKFDWLTCSSVDYFVIIRQCVIYIFSRRSVPCSLYMKMNHQIHVMFSGVVYAE